MQDDFVLEEFLAVEAKWFEASHITSFTAHHSYKLNYTTQTSLHWIQNKVNIKNKVKNQQSYSESSNIFLAASVSFSNN